MFTRDKESYCGKCRKKTKHVKCPNCRGKGNTMWTTCGNKCASGYKCINGTSDKYHS